MSKRTNEQSKDMDGGDVDITPIKEPNTKKQKVITVQKMEDILSNNKNLTIIIVAHRLSTLINCDYLLELQNGKISRQGKPKEVLANLI